MNKPMAEQIHPLYEGEVLDKGINPTEKLITYDEAGNSVSNFPIRFKLSKPADENGKQRDQTNDAADHMRYAASLKLPELVRRALPRAGRAIIVGGAPSITDHLEEIRALAADPDNMVFAINWSHAWLIKNGIVPTACVFFEIDAEPDSSLKGAHKDVTYYICSHCHPKTFDELKDFKRVLWHTPPNSEIEKEVGDELFPGSNLVGGGVGTFTRTLTIALQLGYRNIELFGIDSSYPDDSPSTHVAGYETPHNVKTDSFYVHAKHTITGKMRRFRTMGPLALQVEEFKEYCRVNHQMFALRVHGDSLLHFVHENIYPDQYQNA